jgi:lipopolysaccharide export system protein LptA
MRSRVAIVAGALLLAASTQLSWSQTEERLRLIHADVLRSEVVNGALVRIIEGNVAFQQGDATMTCDRAEWYVDEGRTVFLGNVVIVQEDSRLEADQVVYYEQDDSGLATGNVVLVDASNTLRADSLWYYEVDDRAIARGNVVVTDSSESVVLTGGMAEYFREREYVRMTRDPVLVQQDSLGREELRIVSDEMEIFDRGARSRAVGNVVITKDSTVARCGEAVYFREEGHLVLRKEPVALQGSEEIRGQQIDLWLKDNKLDWVEVLQGAQVVSKIDTVPGVNLENRLSGERMLIYLQDERLHKVVIEGRAYSVYHAIEDSVHTGTNEAIGDTMTLQFDRGRLKRVSILSTPGKSLGRLFPPESKPATPLAPSGGAKPSRPPDQKGS